MEALWATILFSGFALEVIIRQRIHCRVLGVILHELVNELSEFPG